MQIFILSNEDIKLYNLYENKIENILDDIDQNINIYNNSFIMSDSKNNMWISSSDGVRIYLRDSMEIKELKKDTRTSNYLSSNVITYFYEDTNGVIWIGTDRGINILNGNKQFKGSINGWGNYGYMCDKDIISILQHDEYIDSYKI